jgi:hypothetical protein
MMKKFLFFLSAFLLFFSFLNCQLLADETIPLEIEAASLRFETRDLIVAEGAVRLVWEKWVVRAGRVKIDTTKKWVVLEDKIIFKSSGQVFYGKKAEIDLDSGAVVFDGFYSGFSDQKIKGRIFIRAKKIKYEKSETFSGVTGVISSCNLNPGHYHLEVGEFEYYPDDKIIAKNLTLKILGNKVLTRAYQVINLKRNKRQTFFPVIGQNQVEGFFVKNFFDYFFNEQNTGLVEMDFFQRKGLGVGIDHVYEDGDFKSDWFLYHIDERDSGIANWIGRLNWDFQLLPGLKAKLEHNYYDMYLVPAGRREDTKTRFSLAKKDKEQKLNFKMENKENRLGTPYQNFSSFLDYSRNFSGALAGNLLLDFHKNKKASDPEDLELEVKNLGLSYDFGFSNLEFSLKKRFDLDLDNYHGDESFPYFEKLPEVKFSVKPQDLGLLDAAGFFGFSRFVEYSRQRYLKDFGFTKASSTFGGLNLMKKIPVFQRSLLSFDFGASQYFYSTGDARWGVTQKVQLENRVGNILKHTLTHRHDYFLGGNPFTLIDRSSDTNFIRSALILNDPAETWYFDLSGGYNFLTRYYDDLLTKLELGLTPLWRTSLATGYNLNKSVYKDLIWKNRWSLRDELVVDGGLRYDINSGQIRAGEFLFDWTVGQRWENRFRFMVDYVFQKNSNFFELRGFKVIKDLHCFDLTFVYQAAEQQFLVTLNIKAFPGEVADIGSGREGLFLKEP